MAGRQRGRRGEWRLADGRAGVVCLLTHRLARPPLITLRGLRITRRRTVRSSSSIASMPPALEAGLRVRIESVSLTWSLSSGDNL